MLNESAARVRQYDGSTELRSLADAVAKLVDFDDFSEHEIATFKTWGWTLQPGVDVAFAALLGPARVDRPRLAVTLPPCCTFSAKTTGGVRETFRIALLNEAITDSAANLTLGNGEHVHSAQFRPDWSWCAWDELDDRIVRCAIDIGKVEHLFYWPIDEALLPGVKKLRYDVLLGWRIVGSCRLLRDIAQNMPGVSRRRAATALKRAGFELDRPRNGVPSHFGHH
jgi:hypothetical protein